MDQIAHEPREIFVARRDVFPIEPRGFVVLTISVVVAALRPADFVAREQHRNPEG